MKDLQSLVARFESPVSGRAYRPFTRYLTLCFVSSLLTYGAYVLGRSDGVAGTILLLMAMAAAVMLVGAWYIVMGRTTIDGSGIRQDGLFPKAYRWHEINRARFLKMPLSARLLLTVGSGPIRAIHSGDGQLDAAFRDIAEFYRRVWEK